MTLEPVPPTLPGVIDGLRRRVDSLERAPAATVRPHRVCITAAGQTDGYTTPVTTVWRPWTAVSFDELRMETWAAPNGGLSLEVGLWVNGAQVGAVVAVTDADTQGFARFDDPVTVDVFDRVWFQVTLDEAGASTWRGVTVQALGVSDHPVSAGLVFIDAGGGG